MKKLLNLFKPLPIAMLSLLIVSGFLRFNLHINSDQLVKEFKNQNFRELYSLDTLKVSSRLNSLSTVINWVCIDGAIAGKSFYKMERGECKTSLLQEKKVLVIPEANNLMISFTIRLPKEIEYLFTVFFIMQIILIIALIISTRKSEEDKRLAEIKINKLARQMSHDIRSPLATLNTVVNGLEKLSDEEVNLLEKSISRINDIANSLLEKSVRNKELPKITYVEGEVLVREMFDEKKLEIQNLNNITISLNVESANTVLYLDSVELKRIISNLINNAIQAKNTTQALDIKISTKNSEKNFIITIMDNGIGIPEHVLTKLGKTEFSSKKDGNGLGLMHAFEMVASWNGKISISSKENLGTEITITLPQRITSSPLTILIDNDELVRLTWERVAKKHDIPFNSISDLKDLKKLQDLLTIETIFYIDSELDGGQKGENIARYLYESGYKNLYLTTGHNQNHFKQNKIFKGIIDKTPPWN